MLIVFTVISILFFPADLFAWGPVAHLSYGLDILNNLSLLSQPLQGLLGGFRLDYLYGCLAADITLKKDLVPYIHHCHNWDVGISILKEAKTKEQQAFAYGYLSHLGADTISHNYFVPYQTAISHQKRGRRHLYWELRYDTAYPTHLWALARRITTIYHGSDHDTLLQTTLKRTLFPFGTNKVIFNTIMRGLPAYKALKPLFKKSTGNISTEDRKEYERLVFEATVDFLNKKEKSKSYQLDPSGEKALSQAKDLRKKRRPDLHRTQIREKFRISFG